MPGPGDGNNVGPWNLASDWRFSHAVASIISTHAPPPGGRPMDRRILLTLLLGLALAPPARADDAEPAVQDTSAKADLKQGIKDAAHGAAEGAKKVGQAEKEGAKEGWQATKEGARKVGQGTKEAGHKVGQGAKDAGHKV